MARIPRDVGEQMTPHTSRSTWIRLVAAILALLVIVAGCGGDDESEATGVASIDASGGEDGPPQRQEIEDAVLDFTQCLRDEGFDVPDIELDANGAPIIRTQDVAGVDISSREFQSAFASCTPILTSAGAFSFDADPELQAIFQDQLQEFSQCMRQEGVTDFPDPIAGAAGIPYPLDAFSDFTSDAFQAALETCQQQIGFSGLGG